MATNSVKNAILRAKINGAINDIMVKTIGSQVFLNDGSTLEAKLATLAAAADVQALQKALDELGALAAKDTIAVEDLAPALATLINNKAEASALTQEIERATAAEGVNATAAANALAEAQKKVASVTAGDASVTVGGTATAPTVAAKLSAAAGNALELADDGLKVIIPTAAEYTIEKASESGEYAAVYALKKDGVQVGDSINIPKDMVVEEGSVVENPEGQAAGTYIKLVLQNVEEPLYINVGSLIEYVTSGSAAGDMVVVAVSEDHKVTATITDGTITLAKLSSDVQTAIGKAHDHANKAVLDGIDADKVAAWDGVVEKVDTGDKNVSVYVEEKINALGIDAYAKTADLGTLASKSAVSESDLDTNLAEKVNAASEGNHSHLNKDVLDNISAEKVAAWDAAEQNAKSHANGLNEAMGTRVGAVEGRMTTAEGKIAALESKAKIFYSNSADGEPAGMTENDLWVAFV